MTLYRALGFILFDEATVTSGPTTGDVVHEAGGDYQTVLSYEREGLIEEPARLDNGYLPYPQEAVRTIQFIQRANDLGFTLDEARNLLEIRDGLDMDCDEVESLARKKRRDLQIRIEKLQTMESVLSDFIDECADGVYGYCPILETLTEDETDGSTS